MRDMSASVANDRHGADEDWLDYARSLGTPDKLAALAAHLGTGCARCGETLALWRGMIDAVARDRATSPPDWLLRQAKGAFSVHKRLESAPLSASLVFDSFRQAAAGVRSSSAGTGPRQMAFRAGRYLVRLRAEEAGNARTLLVGQVFDEQKDSGFLPEVTVMAFSGKEAVDQTVTNRLGEFAFDIVPAHDIKLAIGLARDGFLTVALPVAADAGDVPPAGAKRLDWKRGL